MKKYLLVLASVFMLALTTSAQSNDLFKANEIGLSLGTTYTVEKGSFQNNYDLNFNLGAQYYVTKYFGFEVNAPVYEKNGVSFHDVSFGLLARYPWRHFAPYIGVGASYDWNPNLSYTVQTAPPACVPCEETVQVSDLWTYYAKLGIEFRVVKHVGVFVEGNYVIDSFNRFSDGGWRVGAGIRVSF